MKVFEVHEESGNGDERRLWLMDFKVSRSCWCLSTHPFIFLAKGVMWGLLTSASSARTATQSAGSLLLSTDDTKSPLPVLLGKPRISRLHAGARADTHTHTFLSLCHLTRHPEIWKPGFEDTLRYESRGLKHVMCCFLRVLVSLSVSPVWPWQKFVKKCKDWGISYTFSHFQFFSTCD